MFISFRIIFKAVRKSMMNWVKLMSLKWLFCYRRWVGDFIDLCQHTVFYYKTSCYLTSIYLDFLRTVDHCNIGVIVASLTDYSPLTLSLRFDFFVVLSSFKRPLSFSWGLFWVSLPKPSSKTCGVVWGILHTFVPGGFCLSKSNYVSLQVRRNWRMFV